MDSDQDTSLPKRYNIFLCTTLIVSLKNISQKRSASLQSSNGEEDDLPESPLQVSKRPKLERSMRGKSGPAAYIYLRIFSSFVTMESMDLLLLQ